MSSLLHRAYPPRVSKRSTTNGNGGSYYFASRLFRGDSRLPDYLTSQVSKRSAANGNSGSYYPLPNYPLPNYPTTH